MRARKTRPPKASNRVRAYRFALEPTPAQDISLRSHCGAQRFAYNWGLRLVKANLDQRSAERTYGIAEADLTPAVDWSAYGLRKVWNEVKNDVAPWWQENSKEAYSSGLANLAAALSNWAASKAGNRKGTQVRFPRFKTRKALSSCRFTTGAFGLVDGDRRHVKLPRIGIVRTHESTRKLARRAAAGTARIRSVSVSHRRGRWFGSFSAEVPRMTPEATVRGDVAVVGVDMGIRHLAVVSTPVPGLTDENGMVANPNHLEHAQRDLRRLQRQAARRRGPQGSHLPPSERWEKTQPP